MLRTFRIDITENGTPVGYVTMIHETERETSEVQMHSLNGHTLQQAMDAFFAVGSAVFGNHPIIDFDVGSQREMKF